MVDGDADWIDHFHRWLGNALGHELVQRCLFSVLLLAAVALSLWDLGVIAAPRAEKPPLGTASVAVTIAPGTSSTIESQSSSHAPSGTPPPTAAPVLWSLVDPAFPPDGVVDIVSWARPISYLEARTAPGSFGGVLMDPRAIESFPPPTVVPPSGRVLISVFLHDHLRGNRFFARFFDSLRRTGSDAAVILFANLNVASDIRRKLHRWNVSVVGYPKNPVLEPNQFWISSLRFLLYRLAMLRLPSARTIMVSDAFDVYFQRDPFPLVESTLLREGKRIYAAVEPCKMGESHQPDDGLNVNWITKCFGHDAVKHVAHQQVSCSGTTFGFRNAMTQYFVEMDRVFRRDQITQCTQLGLDQGVHNFLLYTKLRPYVLFDPVFTGLILTGNGMTDWLFDGVNGTQLNWLGVPYAVVHQPNRCGVRRNDPTRFWEVVQSPNGEAWWAGASRDLPPLNAKKDLNAAAEAQFVATGPSFRRSRTGTCERVAWPTFLEQHRLWG